MSIQLNAYLVQFVPATWAQRSLSLPASFVSQNLGLTLEQQARPPVFGSRKGMMYTVIPSLNTDATFDFCPVLLQT